MNESDIYVVAARRTPLGAFQGELQALSAVNLAAAAIRATMDQGGVSGDVVKFEGLFDIGRVEVGQLM